MPMLCQRNQLISLSTSGTRFLSAVKFRELEALKMLLAFFWFHNSKLKMKDSKL